MSATHRPGTGDDGDGRDHAGGDGHDGGGWHGVGGADGRPRDGELLEARVTALEGALLAMGRELRTRRLAVVDAAGGTRLTAEVVGGTVELRLTATASRHDGVTAVVLHAGSGAADEVFGHGLGGLMGVQLWADGDAVAELDAWPGSDGQWRPHLHLGGPS